MEEKQVSIITVNYNGFEDTCALIDSITYSKELEVIVVDNASENTEGQQLATRYPWIKVIESKENLGFAGGNNLGIREAQGKYLFFVNNDTYFTEFNLRPLIERLESSEKIAVVCPKIRFAWGNKPIQFAGYTLLSNITLRNKAIGNGEEDRGQYNTAHPTPYAHGAAMMVKREAIRTVGAMPTCYFLYYEELDWSMMFTKAGYTIWYEPLCTIYHKESKSTGQDSPLKAYYITRNRLLFVRRHGKNKWISYLYLTTVVLLRDIVKYGIQNRTDLIRACCRGVRDFYQQSLPS